MHRLRGSPSIIVFLFYFACLWTSIVSMCPAKCHCNDESLRVNCSHADLGVIPITLNPDLREFNLQRNYVKAIKSSFGVYHNLQYLDVSQNDLTSVGVDSFVRQGSLQILLLNRNVINSLHNETFKGLARLQVLDLSSNQLEEIEGSVFNPLLKLEKLDLSGNWISSLSNDAFTGLSSLKTLSLRNNRLRTVPSQPLSRIPHILVLDLSANYFSDVTAGDFDVLDDLERLQLDGCDLSTLVKGVFRGLDSLVTLNLSGNKLSQVPTEALSDTPRLEELAIGQNAFLELPFDAFRGLKYLKGVQVRYSKFLTAVRAGAFSANTNLESVTFEGNSELRVLEVGAFDGLPNLRRVSLRGNALEYLDPALLPWDELEFLDARDNPLVCNCSLKWLRTFLRRNSSSSDLSSSEYEFGARPVKAHPDESSLVFCNQPDHLKGQLVGQLGQDDLDCDAEDSRNEIIIGVIVAIVILVVALAMAAFRCRETIAGVLKTKWNGNRKEPQYQKTNGEEENNILQAAQHPLKNTPVTEL